MALHLPPFSLSPLPLPSSSSRPLTFTPITSSPAPVPQPTRAAAATATTTITAASSSSRWKTKEMILGKPTERVEKGKYSYDVSTLIDKLSELPPRGSIARCLETFRKRLSLQDFALVFKEFARRGDWQRSLRLFKYMQRQSWCRPDEHIHALLIGSLSRADASLLDRCLDIFDRDMPTLSIPRTALSYTALINAFARHRRHQDALELLRRMTLVDRVSPVVPTYNSVLLACAPAAAQVQFDVLLGLFADMRHHGLRPDLTTYNALLAGCAARSLPTEAESIFRSMNEAGVPPDPTTHAYLVDTFARAGCLSCVNEILREMETAGYVPDATSYNVLVEAYAGMGDARAAVGVLRQMQAAGCAPNAATYSVLLGLYGRSRKYEDVRELFLEMKVGNTAPDAVTYNILIKVFGEGGYFREVVTLFNDMVEEKVEPDMETYEGLFFACGKGGLYEDAKKVLLYMHEKGVVMSSKTYDGMIEAYGHAALYEEALVAFNTMHEIGSMPTIDTYNTLLDMYARGGLTKEVEAVLSQMEESGMQRNEDTYNMLIEVYCQAGRFEDALKAFVEMQKSRCIPTERTLEVVLGVYCTAGLVDESREQFEEIKRLGITPSVVAYCLLLSVYAKNDKWDTAYELLDEMKSTRASNTHQVIGSMIKGNYDDKSNWQMVEYVFDNYNSEGCGFGLRFYNALLEALWWLGQKARAMKVLVEATDRGLFPELYRQSRLVWSVDVHRMSVGGALIAISSWLKDIHEKFEMGEDLPHVASVVVVRGAMEKSSSIRSIPVVKAAYPFLKDNISPSFTFPGWNNGRITCQRNQLKRILSLGSLSQDSVTRENLISISDMAFPVPGTKLHTMGPQREDQISAGESVVENDLQIPEPAKM